MGTLGLRVASFNVRYQGTDEGPDAWPRRRPLVAGAIRFHRPDVVGLQECWLDQLPDLRARLPGYDWVGERHLDGEHTPVGYRADRFDARDLEVFALSETPADPGSVGWDGTYPRFATRVEFRHRSGQELTVFNVHFSNDGPRARRESARLLRRRVADRDGGPAILTGDLNCQPGSVPHGVLTAGSGPGQPLVDARTAAETPHYGPEGTYNGYETPVPDRRIDYVLATPDVTVEGHGIPVVLDAEGRYPSDHFPVVADLALEP